MKLKTLQNYFNLYKGVIINMITTEFIVTWQTTRKREKGKTYSHVFTDLEKARAFKKEEENIKKL